LKESEVKLTRFELEVMGALWALGSGSVREIQERLPAGKAPAYTTVQTIVYRLEEKGAVRRVKKVGNAHVFEPVVTRRATVRRLFGEMLGFFGGSPRTLMAQLVEAGHLTLADLREAEETLARLEAEKAGGRSGAGDAGGADEGGDGAGAPGGRARGAARGGRAAGGKKR
jgi:predicted transcriptional regulator